MKRLIFLAMILSLNLADADTAQMNNNLVRLINQIDAMMPVIDEAKAAQDKTARMTFHFDTWKDAKGQVHFGLRQDLFAIRQALIDQINGTNLTPVYFEPLEYDFLGR